MKIVGLILFVTLAVVLHLFGNNAGTFAILVTVIVVPVLSAVTLLFVRAAVKINAPLSCAKGERVEVAVAVTGKLLRFFNVHYTIVCENIFTGEIQQKLLTIPTHHAGALKIFAQDAFILCPLGLFRKKITPPQAVFTIVQPIGYDINIPMPNATENPESDIFSTQKPGMDVSETFAIREYQPGDPIRSIHWKLTEKMDKTMVREFGLPVAGSVFLFLATPEGTVAPTDWDITAEMLYSASLAFLESGISTSVGWNTTKLQLHTPEDAMVAMHECFLTYDKQQPAHEILNDGNILVITPGARETLTW